MVCDATRKNKTTRPSRFGLLVEIRSEVRSSNRDRLSWVGSMPCSFQGQRQKPTLKLSLEVEVRGANSLVKVRHRGRVP